MTKEYDRKHRHRKPPQGDIAFALRFTELAYAPDPPAAADPEELKIGKRPPQPRLQSRHLYQCPNCQQSFSTLGSYRGHRDVDHGGRYGVPRLMPKPVHHPDCAGPGCGSCACWCHEKVSAA